MPGIQHLLSQGPCCHAAGFTLSQSTEPTPAGGAQGLAEISSAVSELLCSGRPLGLSELRFPYLQSRIMTSTPQKCCENECGQAIRMAPNTEYDLEAGYR